MKKPRLEFASAELKALSRVGADGVPNFPIYAAGEWQWGEEWMDVASPIDMSVVARVPRTRPDQIQAILSEIDEIGKHEMRRAPGEKRLEIFHRTADVLEGLSDDFAHALVVNAGKTVLSARGEVRASIERLRRSDLDTRRILGDYIPGDWSDETLETEGVVRREPIGLVLAIIPFNYPLFDTVNKLVYSTIVGNAIVIKPASSTPLPVIMLGKALELAGFPKHGLGIVTMPGSEMGSVVTDHRVNGISLTGSTETGLRLLKSAGIKQFVLELGGGDPAIVLSDADLPYAAQRIVAGVTSYSGQRCDAIKLILAESPIYDGLRKELLAELSKCKVGDPRAEGVTMGPLIDRETAEGVETNIRNAVKSGGKVIFGGSVKGNYIEPTVIEISKEDAVKTNLYKNELFAAVALLVKVEGVEEAVVLSNGRRYGLDAAIFGKDMNSIRRIIRMLEVGAVYVNDSPKHGIGYFPFGGRKDSGIGREGIGYTLDYVTAHKSIVYNYRGRGVWEYL